MASDSSKTVEKMLTVLATLADGRELTARELSVELGMNRTVVQRLLSTLQHRNFVSRLGTDGYALAFHLQLVGDSVQPQLRHAAAPIVRRLAEQTSGTVTVQIADDIESVVLIEQPPRNASIRVRHKTGTRTMMDAGAGGRVLLAFAPERTQAKVPGFSAETAASIRSHGYVLSERELQPGVYAIAAPVRDGSDEVIAAVTVLIPGSVDNAMRSQLGAVLNAVTDIELRLGRSHTRDA